MPFTKKNPYLTTMSSAGHVMDVINRMRQNSDRKASRRTKFKENSTVTDAAIIEETTYDFPEVSTRRLAKIKLEIKLREQKKHRRELLILWVIILVVLAASAILLL